MSEHIQHTIEQVKSQVHELQLEVTRKQRMANDLAEMAGLPPVYHQVEDASQASTTSIRRDQWYGQPMSKAAREYLEMRRASDLGPATVAEIFEALKQGGFEFAAKDDENAKRGLRISLTKNTSIFHRLPDGKTYGLLDWYPDIKSKRAGTGTNGSAVDDKEGANEALGEATKGEGDSEPEAKETADA